MNREQAETLLAALVADELDEPMRGELLAYLKTDAAMAERLGDMRLAAGLVREGLEQASADVPAAMDDAQRAALVQLIEREPITAEVAEGVVDASRSRLGPLFSLRIAGAVAACMALGVGLLGMMLPELGDARRTARRMMNSDSPAVDYYAYLDESEAAEEQSFIPRSELNDSSSNGVVGSTLGLSQGNDIDFSGGTRVRTDAIIILTDGQADDLLSASSGTLALGSELGIARTHDADKAIGGADKTRYAIAPQVDPDAIKALTEPLASLGPPSGETSNGLYWQRTTRAGDAITPADKLTSETWKYDKQKPSVVTGETITQAPATDPVPAPEPMDENRYAPTELDDRSGGQGGGVGVQGGEGLFAELPAPPATPSSTGTFGAITLGDALPDPVRWDEREISKQLGNDFGTQYGNDRLDVDGDPGAPAFFGIPLLDGRDTEEFGFLDGQQGQQNQQGKGQSRGYWDGKQWYDDVPGEAQGLDSKVRLRDIRKPDSPDEAVLPKPSEPAAPHRDATFSIEVPTDRTDLAGQISELQVKLAEAQLIVDRNTAAMQIGAAENGSKDDRLRDQSEQLKEQLGRISELQGRRDELSAALIAERTRDRRLADNDLRIQEEDKALASQLDLVPDFDQVPGFDLNDALSNSSSGGGKSDVADSQLMIEARRNTAAEKAEQAERAYRAGQLNAATQLYEDATLLAPDNAAYRGKLAETQEKLQRQMRPLGTLDNTAVDRTVDRKAAIAEYEKAMTEATKLLEQQDYLAANNAIIEARTLLSRERQVFDTEDYNSRVNRSNQLQDLMQATQARTEADQLRSIELDRSTVERHIASETERRKAEEVQSYLRKARALQLEKKYAESVAELDAALFLDPDNPVIKGLRDMVQDTEMAADRFGLKRNRDLEIAQQTLQNSEATTPFSDILTYPGDWPELTAGRLREEGRNQAAEADKPAITPEPEPAPEAEEERQARVAPPVNPWVLTEQDAQSTFALDTDTASYELARRTIHEQAQLPPIASVRMEEFVNRFDYQYPAGRDAHDTFTVHADAGPSPFAGSNGGEAVLMKVGVRGRVVARDQMKPAHYVFVIDASGSMAREDRLPLVQQSLAMLLGQLGEQDTVSLVSYETRPYLLLEHASASDAKAIMRAAATIQTGGSTNLTEGLKLGYQVAGKHFSSGGVNRVILCSDGVANVGNDDAKQMLDAVNEYRQQGVTLMTVGVGVDGQTAGQAASGAERFNDGLMEQLANRGDGQYIYLGSAEDAQRQFVEDLAATRPTIAYDAKIQVAFDPSRVRRYRLIGYENRDIADRDFRNDTVDAGEVGSGQSATALYELELWPTHRRRPAVQVDQDPGKLATVYVRYRDAQSNTVKETATAFSLAQVSERTVSQDPRFYLAACAAEFAELLRNSEHAKDGSFARLHRIAKAVAEALPLDRDAAELAELIGRAQGLPRAGQ